MHALAQVLAMIDAGIEAAETLSRENQITNEMGPKWNAGSLGAGIFMFMFGRL